MSFTVFNSNSICRLIIADEMDYLITRDRGVLHELFMLTTLPFSRCILIGTSFALLMFIFYPYTLIIQICK